MTADWERAKEFLSSLQESLERKSFAELAALPDVSELRDVSDLPGFSFTQWRERPAANRVRIVLSAHRRLVMGIGDLRVSVGFELDASGGRRTLGPGELDGAV